MTKRLALAGLPVYGKEMPPSRTAVLALAFFLVGIAVGSRSHVFPSLPFWYLSAGLGVFSFSTKKVAGLFLIGACFTALCVGSLYTRSWRALHYREFPATGSFTGYIVDSPDIRQDKTFLTFQPDGQKGRLLLKAARFPRYRYGDRLSASGSIEKPEAFSGFNYPLFLEKSGVYGIMGQPRLQLLKPAGFSIKGLLYSLRDHIEQPMQRQLPEPESSFLGGILLGSKRAIPQDIQDALKATGTSHIIAISGANITIMLGLLLQFLPLYTRRQQFSATVLIGIFMSLLTGASASVVRGAFVASLGQYLRLKGRRAWVTPLILVSATLMVFNNPLLLVADPGFQLSFAAYAGLLYLGTPLSTWLERLKWLHSLPDVVKGSFTETLAATVGTAPLSFLLFGQLSLLGLAVNPLILWLLPAITFLGMLFCLLFWLPVIRTLISLPLWLLLHAVLSTIQWFGRFSFATIHWKS